ncbi:MAG: hypothetical protein L0H74_00185 [Brachybacterium sp.]|nr:hypothetical protein [Brachybacterium sp.]
MSQQTIRQQARVAARGSAQRRRRERLARERRIEDLAVAVLTAVGERDAAVAAAEQRAGAALVELTQSEGLTLREAVAWCDEQVSVREATRLRRLVTDEAPVDAAPAGEREEVDAGASAG